MKKLEVVYDNAKEKIWTERNALSKTSSRNKGRKSEVSDNQTPFKGH